jgi:DNA end-binding protein Ku
MAPRALRAATLTFGLVTIPVRFYTATSSRSPHFHLVHEVCGSRIKQQLYCPTCKRVVERSELVRGYELRGHRERGGQHVRFTEKELEALESEASPALDITEFVPLDTIDPTYFETTYYLGPDKGGDKPYRLLVETMHDIKLAAVIQFVWRGKENVAAIRAHERALVLHTLYFADEVRDPNDIGLPRGEVREGELRLAKRLVEELRSDEFDPTRHPDVYRARLEQAARQKARGRSLEVAEYGPKPARVIDIMEALKNSLRKPAAPAERRAASARATGRPRRGRRRTAA